MKGAYPTPNTIAQTVSHPGTSLSGTRRFYSAAGVVAYAGEHSGMASLAGRVWLPPSATRRLSTFLDMVTPAVGGLIMSPSGVQPQRLELGAPDAACDRLSELAEAHLHNPIGPSNATLCSIELSTLRDWDWSGILSYDHRYRFRNGEYVTSRPQVLFHVRRDDHPTRAHIMVEIRHTTDFEQVYRWAARLAPDAERWSITPFALFGDESRHDEIRALARALASDNEVAVAHPNSERVSDGASEPEVDEFVTNMKEARYSTRIQSLDSLIRRAEQVDHSILSAFDLYHWEGSGSGRAAVRVRVKQHDTDPLTIAWGSVREPRDAAGALLPGKVLLDSEGWALMTAAEWSEDDRMTHLHRLWLRLIAATEQAANSAAA
jgi:hypothetical protein